MFSDYINYSAAVNMLNINRTLKEGTVKIKPFMLRLSSLPFIGNTVIT